VAYSRFTDADEVGIPRPMLDLERRPLDAD
jgi:hypothetical protein